MVSIRFGQTDGLAALQRKVGHQMRTREMIQEIDTHTHTNETVPTTVHEHKMHHRIADRNAQPVCLAGGGYIYTMAPRARVDVRATLFLVLTAPVQGPWRAAVLSSASRVKRKTAQITEPKNTLMWFN